MKISDRYKLALHNIKNNKSRSLLTIIIVYLMSFVIMALLFLSISFSTNVSNITNKYVEDTLEYITTDYLYIQNGSSNNNGAINNNSYKKIDECLEKNNNIIDIVKFSSPQNKVFLTNFSFPLNNLIEIKDGIFPTNENKNTYYVLVSQDYISKYQNMNNVTLTIGDTFSYQYKYFSLIENETYTKDLTLYVGGIFNNLNKTFATSSSANEKIINEDTEVILDCEYLLTNFPKVKLTEGTFYSSTSNKDISTSKLLNLEKKFVNELNDIIPKYTLSGNQENAVYNLTLNELKTYSTINLLVIGVSSFMGLILIILSIGSLSNTIMISVNKNKKFIGLLKSLGIKQKDLESIIHFESFTLISIGILFSFLTLILMKNVFIIINQQLLNGTISYLLTSINYKIIFITPFYIPLIVLGFYILLTILSSKSSINEITQKDPINMISEVI